MTTSKPKLLKTDNYDLFEMHPHNRPLHLNNVLRRSMQKHGFMPSSPLHCVMNGNKLRVVRGHHRLSVAKQLGIPVYYIVDDSNTDLFDLEGASSVAWNIPDFANARAQAGDKHAQQLIKFIEQYGIPIGTAAALLGGEMGCSSNKIKQIKTGSFRVTKSGLEHASEVVAITDALHEKGIPFARHVGFVGALSKAILTPEVDYKRLCHRFATYSHVMTRRSTVKEYLEEIEALYNYTAKGKRIPLSFLANEAAKKRSVITKNSSAG